MGWGRLQSGEARNSHCRGIERGVGWGRLQSGEARNSNCRVIERGVVKVTKWRGLQQSLWGDRAWGWGGEGYEVKRPETVIVG